MAPRHPLLLLGGLAGIVLLAACAPQRGPTRAESRAAGRALERAGTIADPGKVAATDIAFARAARDDGQWSAFARYAAPGALLHAPDGPVAAGRFLAGRADPADPLRWVPRAVWSSCDGTLAVSAGRFAQPDGRVGDYVTGWALQRGGEYRWTYDNGVLDDPQPAPRAADDTPAGEDVILVTRLDAIEARSADCTRPDAPPPPAPEPLSFADGMRADVTTAKDGTLRYWWEQHGDGAQRVVVEWLREGRWQRPLDMAIPPGGEG